MTSLRANWFGSSANCESNDIGNKENISEPQWLEEHKQEASWICRCKNRVRQSGCLEKAMIINNRNVTNSKYGVLKLYTPIWRSH